MPADNLSHSIDRGFDALDKFVDVVGNAIGVDMSESKSVQASAQQIAPSNVTALPVKTVHALPAAAPAVPAEPEAVVAQSVERKSAFEILPVTLSDGFVAIVVTDRSKVFYQAPSQADAERVLEELRKLEAKR